MDKETKEMLALAEKYRAERAEFEERLKSVVSEMYDICEHTVCSECKSLYPTLYKFCTLHMDSSPNGVEL